jgi:NhaP-type Na+/H+ or K+/H+ antiporter
MAATGSHPQLVLLFMFFTILIGALLRFFIHVTKVQLPYTMLLLMYGMGIGVVQQYYGGDGSVTDLSRSAALFSGMDPHLLLYVFLPPLIFESASAMNYHTFSRVLKKSLFLAGPGLVFGISSIAALLKLTVFTDWSWTEALLLGSILSATDPVAVVALLRELGVNPQLGTLIEGESLVNDGTAVVVFLVLMEALKTGAYGTGTEILWEFVRLSILGSAFGYTYGLISLEFTSRVFNDAPVEIAVTLSSAYLVFYLAEGFKMSGILAVVALGVSYSKHGQTKISPEVQHFMHEVNRACAHLCTCP